MKFIKKVIRGYFQAKADCYFEGAAFHFWNYPPMTIGFARANMLLSMADLYRSIADAVGE